MTPRVQWLAGAAGLALLIWMTTLWIAGSGSGTGAIQSGAIALSAGSVTSPATTRFSLAPSPTSSPTPLLPEEYAILETHNPFGRGHSSGRAGGADASLVFKGAVKTDSTVTAFFEDLATKQIKPLGIGDSIGRGQIKSIDLETVVYASAGLTRSIAVGQNLDGVIIAPAPPPPPPQPPQLPQARVAAGARSGPQPGMPAGMVGPAGPGAPANAQPAADAGPPNDSTETGGP